MKIRTPITLVLLVAATAAPAARPADSVRSTYTLDPVIAAAILNHQSDQVVPFTTEHAAGQNGTGQASQAVPFTTEHAAGQNGDGKAVPLDSMIATAIRNHREGENPVARSAAVATQPAPPNRFDWTAAGIGASVALAALLLGVGVVRMVPRRGRTRLA